MAVTDHHIIGIVMALHASGGAYKALGLEDSE
jgi:hypothetical protein